MAKRMLTPMPTLQTERLILRAHTRADFAACAAMWSDPRVTAYIGGTPSSPQQTWMRMLGYRGLWSLLDYGYWAVEERSSGAFIGDVGFADFQRVLVPSIAGIPEMGWVLAPDAHGRGYATEATSAALAWADEHLDVPRIACIIAPANEPSIRVAAKCGFLEIARTTYQEKPTILFERSR
jgi:RimJ/RimL family protein N-acetyltransferase